MLYAITLKRGAQSLFSIIVYSNTSETQESKLGGSRLLKCSLSERTLAVTVEKIIRSKSPMVLITCVLQLTWQIDLYLCSEL